MRRLVNVNKNTGFTIVEILIVIVVISILAAVTVVAYRGFQDRARDTKNESTAKSFVSSVEKIGAMSAGSALPTVANLNDTTWRSANSFKSSLLYDAEGKIFAGIGSSDVSQYVNFLMPDNSGDSYAPCAALIQVRSK